MAASRFRFHPAAELELNAAASWYESRCVGLGIEFSNRVREKIAAVLEAPARWRLVRGSRRIPLGRFPYAIVYREISSDEIEIVAIAHFKRRPEFWSRR